MLHEQWEVVDHLQVVSHELTEGPQLMVLQLMQGGHLQILMQLHSWHHALWLYLPTAYAMAEEVGPAEG